MSKEVNVVIIKRVHVGQPGLIPDITLRPGSDAIGILHRAKQSAKVLLNLRRLPRPSTLEEQVYRAVVREGDVCFDIGANVGWIALFLARTAGAAGKVIAFEPVWPTYMSMCANIQNAINVKAPIFTMPFGLAEEEKTAIIHVPDGRFEFGSLARPDELAQVFPEMQIACYECRFISLDGFLRSSAGLVADFWKLDIEGAELFALRGAAQHFAAGHRPLIVAEVYAPWEERSGYGPWDLFAPLLDLGYRFLFLCPGGLIEHLPSQPAPFPPEFEHGYNVVAYVPERHADRVRSLAPLRTGTGQALGVARGLYPNRPLSGSIGESR
jgi:FkbM family methyltransferase